MMRTTPRRLAAAAVTIFAIAACSDSDSTESTSPNGESKLFVVLSAVADTIPESTTKSISARVTDQTGLLRLVPISWRSSDPAVASVSGGTITGVGPGIAMVIASAGSGADSAIIVVTPKEHTLDVQPSAAIVALGDTIQFIATVRANNGDIVSVNELTWSSSDTAAARFVNGGSLIGTAEGELLVSAEAAHRRGTGSVRVFKSPVSSVTISPSTANVYKGAQLELDVTLRDQQGRLVEGDVTFGSSDYSKATVNQDGFVTGVSAGSVVITATSGTKTGSATITVLGTPAAAVLISMPSDTVPVGVEMQATATPLDASGNPLTGRTIAYQSANPSVATINSTGTVKGIANGSVNISAIVDGKVASKRISVGGRRATSLSITPGSPSVSVGKQSQLSARVLDQVGAEITGQSISWNSSNQAVALVSQSGLVTALNGGSASISATLVSSSGMVTSLNGGSPSVSAAVGGLSASVVLTVVSAPVASVQVTPATASVVIGGSPITLTAAAFDADGNLLSGRVATWSSQNPTVASVSSSGALSAVGSGSTTVTANIEGRSASVTVTVGNAPAAPVASVTVTLGSATLNVGQQTQAFAVLMDAQGNALSRPITWSSLDTAVAKVNASGLVTSHAGGTVAIMARSEGVSGSASLTVGTPSPSSVASVTLDVPTQDLTAGQQVQSVVTLKDAQGNILTGRTITYSTDNSAIVTVTASGVIRGVGAGYARIRATSGGVTGSEGFTVTGSTSTAPVASITVTPATATLSIGQTSQESAVARDAQSNAIAGTLFTWTTTNPAVATVSTNGLVSAVGGGSATIRAAASGITGSMLMTVTSAPATVASVTLSLSASSILIGGSAQASAIAKDAQGNTITGRPVTWSVGSSLASISSSGLVTGLVAGVVPVTARIDGISNSANLTISAPLPPPATTTVELPRTYLNFSYPVKTGQTITLAAGGDLQAALNTAQRGDEIVLAAGATFTGNFILPAKSGTAANGWITIRSDKLSQLPPIGTRVTPQHAALMPKIVTPDVSAAIATGSGTSGWWLAGIEVTVSASLTHQQYGLITFGESGGTQTTLASVPSDLVLDRTYVHGQTTTDLSRCVALNSARTQVTDSYLSECHGRDFDAQAIAGWNGPGPYKIVNNTLIGAAENILFGGSDPGIAGLVPSDIEIRRNYIFTPLSWKGVWLKKNLFELKNAVRVLVEGNVMDGSWTHGQTGFAVVLKSGNQSGGCRWCRTTDVTFRRNLIRNSGAGFNVAARDDNPNTDTTARRILITENVLDNIATSSYPGESRGFQLLKGTADITIERTLLTGPIVASMMLEDSPGTSRAAFRENVWEHGMYGAIAQGTSPGTVSLNNGAPGAVWTNMTFLGPSQSVYPPGTLFAASESSVALASQLRALVAQATSGVIIP